MFGSISRSWSLIKESMAVLRKDPELMVFPVIAFIAGIVVAGILGGIAAATGAFSDCTAPARFGQVISCFLRSILHKILPVTASLRRCAAPADCSARSIRVSALRSSPVFPGMPDTRSLA